MTVGGNDIGFGPIIKQAVTFCIQPLRSLARGLGFRNVVDCAITSVKEKLAQLEKDFEELAVSLRAVRPKKVLLSEYFDLTHNERGEFCDDFSMERTLGPTGKQWLRIGVTREAAEITYRTVLLELNKVLKAVAAKYGSDGWQFVSGVARQSTIKGWCAKPSWFVTFADSSFKQGYLPEPNGRLSSTDTIGVAHPNIFGQNFSAYRLRCEFDRDGLIPPGYSQRPITPNPVCE
jgi:hypothetical protein